MIGTNNKGVDTYGKQVYEDKEDDNSCYDSSDHSITAVWLRYYEQG